MSRVRISTSSFRNGRGRSPRRYVSRRWLGACDCVSRMRSNYRFCAQKSEAFRGSARGLMQVKDRIQHVRQRVTRLRQVSRELMQHSTQLHRQSARLRAFAPTAAEHFVELRLNDSVALTRTLAQSDGIVDRDMSTPVAD